MRRGVLIYNPTAGQRDRRSRMNALIDEMKGRGLELANAPTHSPGHATEIVRAYLDQGVDLVAVCGGDGTISEAAVALVGQAVPLAILPAGTSNVLARELGIPIDADGARELLTAGTPQSIRVGLANGRPFVLMAGVGLDARIMGRMSPTLKRWFGRAGIFCTVAPEFLRYEFPRLSVATDQGVHEATFAVVCNARHYAGDWIAAPAASVKDDLLDVLLFQSRSRRDFFKLFNGMRAGNGRHLQNGFARVIPTRRARIASKERYELEVQVDGDCVLATPLDCRVAPEALRVLVPETDREN
jgi:diacylglycerol kinase (ATP)